MAAAPGKKIADFAVEIGEASDRTIPGILLRLKQEMKACRPGSGDATRMKLDIWKLDLVPVMLLALKQDFYDIKGSWETGLSITQLVVEVFSGVEDLPQIDSTATRKSLPEAVENMLILARRLEDRYVRSLERDNDVTEMGSDDILATFTTLLQFLIRFLNGFPGMVHTAMQSPWFLQLFITDDVSAAVAMLDLLQQFLRLKPDVLSRVETRLFHSILDEIIYDLSTTESVQVAGSNLKTLLKICQCHPETVRLLSTRYRGLRLLLSKWSGRGTFGKELNQLILILVSGTVDRAKTEQFHMCAIKIQSIWRGFLSRNRLKKSQKGIGKFQVTYRQRQATKTRNDEEEKIEKELAHQVKLSRQRRLRQKAEAELTLMETLPAPIVARHVEHQQATAATAIQSSWRGHKERQLLDTRRQGFRVHTAAAVIQKGVRRWLSRLDRRRHEPPAYSRPPGITDERREELLAMHQGWLDHHPPKQRSREEMEQLHRHAQTLIQRHLYQSRPTRRKEQERESNLARMELDCILLLDAPRLNEVTSSSEIDQYTCRSMPIANRAQQLHNERVKRIQMPWWRTLSMFDEDDDEAALWAGSWQPRELQTPKFAD